jgi:hypothetical protein
LVEIYPLAANVICLDPFNHIVTEAKVE